MSAPGLLAEQGAGITVESTVAVTFRVRVPEATPATDTVFLTGSVAALGPWEPNGVAMSHVGSGIWEATADIPAGIALEYKYTRGTWDEVEWWGSIVGFQNRIVMIPDDVTALLVDNTSTAWSDPAIADNDKAIQFWRDPLVVGTSPAHGAVVSRDPDGPDGPAVEAT